VTTPACSVSNFTATLALYLKAKLRELRKGATLGGLSWKELRDAGRKY